MDYALGQTASILASGQTGVIVGYSCLLNCEPQYLLRYQDAAGDAVERWWGQSALVTEAALAA